MPKCGFGAPVMKRWDRDHVFCGLAHAVVLACGWKGTPRRAVSLKNGRVLAAHLVRPSSGHDNWNWKHPRCGPGPPCGEHVKSPTQDEPAAVARLYEESLEAEVTGLLDTRQSHRFWALEVGDCCHKSWQPPSGKIGRV